MIRTHYEIVSVVGEYICKRATLRECEELIAKYGSTNRNGWSPCCVIYRVQRKRIPRRGRPRC